MSDFKPGDRVHTCFMHEGIRATSEVSRLLLTARPSSTN